MQFGMLDEEDHGSSREKLLCQPNVCKFLIKQEESRSEFQFWIHFVKVLLCGLQLLPEVGIKFETLILFMFLFQKPNTDRWKKKLMISVTNVLHFTYVEFAGDSNSKSSLPFVNS